MLLMLLMVAIEDSTGFVTTISTVSGLAPGYVVITITYGKLILGKRSVVIFINETKPKIITIITATNTVYGFLTLPFDNIFPPTSYVQYLVYKNTYKIAIFTHIH